MMLITTIYMPENARENSECFYSCTYMRDVWCVITIRTYLYSSMEHIFKTDKKFVFSEYMRRKDCVMWKVSVKVFGWMDKLIIRRFDGDHTTLICDSNVKMTRVWSEWPQSRIHIRLKKYLKINDKIQALKPALVEYLP